MTTQKPRGVDVQGSMLYVLAPHPSIAGQKEILPLCVFGIQNDAPTTDRREQTPLCATSKVNKSGMVDYGGGSINVLPESSDYAITRLYELSGKAQKDTLKVVWCWSNGNDGPTLTGDSKDWDLPTDRDLQTWEIQLEEFQWEYPQADDVKATIPYIIVSRPTWVYKAANSELRYPEFWQVDTEDGTGFVLYVGDENTITIEHDVSNGDLKTALELLDNVDTATVTTSGTGYKVKLEPRGKLGGVNATVVEWQEP